ncbi:MAG: T9SS type A sorting domain-containing protein [Bacteroidales bacterium]|nr:T9SS type A sorting domain-containing protein [Bacteroidales bacterium]
MKKNILLVCMISIIATGNLFAQTLIPNAGFEDWTSFGNYSNPTGWDTPNEELMAIPFFGFSVVTQSTDHNSGNFSAKLETKHLTLPPLDVPGAMITANLTVNFTTQTYTVTGGVPINDQPTHLKGFYKYSPKGGDSCVIGIGLYKTTAGIRDTIAHTEFSTKDTVPDWTYFSSWIEYYQVINPDTMQVYAFSTAQEVATPGTILYVDDLYLDYTVGTVEQNLSDKVHIYNDRETKRLILFYDFDPENDVSVRLFNMLGQEVVSSSNRSNEAHRQIIPYSDLVQGVYILEILHGQDRLTKKYFLEN